MMRRWIVAVGLVGVLSLGVAGDRWPGGGDGGAVAATETVQREFFANNSPTAHFTGNMILGQFATITAAAYSGATEHFYLSIATTAAGQTATPTRMACQLTDITTGSGTGTIQLVAFEDGGDTSAEVLGSVSFNLATEGELIKETTTFSAAASTAPYYFGVQLTDGGSVSVVSVDVMCQVVWTRE